MMREARRVVPECGAPVTMANSESAAEACARSDLGGGGEDFPNLLVAYAGPAAQDRGPRKAKMAMASFIVFVRRVV